jgi:hypothetical protein
MPERESLFTDAHFVDELIQFLVHDREFLKTASHLLTVEDFKKRDKHEGIERQVTAQIALNFWSRYRQPVGKMLRIELKEWARKKNWPNEASRQRLLEYGDKCTNGHVRVAPDMMLERVRQYKMEHRLSLAMQQMTDMVESGNLTTDAFLAVARQAVEEIGKEAGRPVDIFSDKELERRIARRLFQQRRVRYPVLLIDPIDRLIRIIARKHMGLVLAPYKRGKTLFFIWLSLVYTLQGLNVLHFTLEDPQEDIEDKFDAAITALPLSRLVEVPNKVRERFQRYKKLLRKRLKVVDGTDGAVTIGAVENMWEQERNRGFVADAIIIDYDDEIRPREKRQERRMEFADIYRDFRSLIARHDLIGWTASQTTRKSNELKIIGGKHIAEDISKIRKASMALSLGQGEWGEDSIFLWIEAHRYDIQHVGANILTDKNRSLFYDRDATLAKEREEREKKTAIP